MRFLRNSRLFAAVGLTALLWCAPPQGAPPVKCDLTPNLKYEKPPKDVCGDAPGFEEFGHMAWQTLKALAWPAAGRGVANDKRALVDEIGGPRVFETFKASWEVFQPNAEPPLAWRLYPPHAPACKVRLDDASLVLASLHKYGNLNQTDLGPGGERITHVVIARQNRSLVRYLTGFNKAAFAKIVAGGLYRPGSLKQSDDPPLGVRLLDDGSITIKSAWIELNGIDNPASFYQREAWVQDPDPLITACRKTIVGLVALHIAHKTESRPQWIWASFEHVRNAPPPGSLDGSSYTFHDGKPGAMPPVPPDKVRTPFPEPTPDNPYPYNPPPYNIQRLQSIPPAIDELNRNWREKLGEAGSVWAHYQLVSIQWPGLRDRPDHTGSGRPVFNDSLNAVQYSASPTPPCRDLYEPSLANTVIETFLQTETACHQDRNCMTCHNQARNYDFVWSIPLSNRGEAAPVTRRDAISKLRALTPWSGRR